MRSTVWPRSRSRAASARAKGVLSAPGGPKSSMIISEPRCADLNLGLEQIESGASFIHLLFEDRALEDAPDLLFDRANDVRQRLFGVDGNDLRPGKRQSRDRFDALLDDRGVHVRLTPCGGLGLDDQLDYEIRWKALRQGVGARLPSAKPAWCPRQTRQQRPVVEFANFILRITVGNNG